LEEALDLSSDRILNDDYSECVSAALVVQHTEGYAGLYCHLWPCLALHIFFHINSKKARFSAGEGGVGVFEKYCVF